MEKNVEKTKKKTATKAKKEAKVLNEETTVVEQEPARVFDNETSDLLKELKHREIANKPKVITSEMEDAMKAEEEVSISNDVERYLDVNITEGLTAEQVDKRNEEGLVNKVTDNHGKSIPMIILSKIFTFFNMLYIGIAVVLVIADVAVHNTNCPIV